MLEPHPFRQSLREALELARTSSSEAAVARLERALEDARRLRDSSAIAMLAKHAGAICLSSDALDRAARYFEEALHNEPDDAYLYLALAEVHERSGDKVRSSQALSRCYEIAKDSGDQDLLRILQDKGAGREDPGG